MGWKEYPLWKKCGLLIFPLCLLWFIILVLISGTIVAIIHNGECWEPPCSLESGNCSHGLGGCYWSQDNPIFPIIIWLFFPAFIVESFLNSNLGQIVANSPFIPSWFIALVLILAIYFISGALIGLILQKTKVLEKDNSSKKRK
jgi:hypothetical protein